MKWLAKLQPVLPLLTTARNETATIALINVSGMVLEWFLGKDLHGIPNWPVLYSMGVGSVVFVLAMLVRREEQRPMVSMLFLINAVAVATALYIRAPYYVEYAQNWVPFEANKLACLVVALLAPSIWVGALGIAAHALTSVIQYEMFAEPLRAKMSFAEPVATLTFATAGFLILVSKFRRIQTENEYRRLQAEKEATQRLVQTVMRLKNLMNTPMQSIQFSTALQREQEHRDDEALQGMEAAVEEMRELNSLLGKYESDIEDVSS